jgi:hypothetical protein
MADFVLHRETVQDDRDDAKLDEMSDDGATKSKLVTQRKRPDLSRFESKFKKGKKLKRVAQNERNVSDEEMSDTGACSEVDDMVENEHTYYEKHKNDVACDALSEKEHVIQGDREKENIGLVVFESENAYDIEQNLEDLGTHDIVESRPSQSRSSSGCLRNASPEPRHSCTSVVNNSHNDLSSDYLVKNRPNSKHGKSLLSGSTEGSSLCRRAGKKVLINPVKPILGNSGVMTAIQKGKVIEITKKGARSKVSLSYADTGQSVTGAACKKEALDSMKENQVENLDQGQVKKFCQALKSKKTLLIGQRKNDQPPYIMLEEDFWEKDLNRNGFEENQQTQSFANQDSKDMSDSDSGDDLPNMEAINSQSSNSTSSSQNSNCSVTGNTNPSKSQNAEFPSSTSGIHKKSNCSVENESSVNSEQQRYVGIGRRRRLVDSRDNTKSKKDGKSKKLKTMEEKTADDGKEEKRSKSKERVGIFEKLSPARSGGIKLDHLNETRSQGVQTDVLPKKNRKEEKMYGIEMKELAESDFMVTKCEIEEDCIGVVELKDLTCSGADDLAAGIRPEISDQRSTGAKSVGGDESCCDGDDLLTNERLACELDYPNLDRDSNIDNQSFGLDTSPSSSCRSKRFKGSYLEYDSDLSTHGVPSKKSGKSRSNKRSRNSDSEDEASQSKCMKSVPGTDSSCGCPASTSHGKNGRHNIRSINSKAKASAPNGDDLGNESDSSSTDVTSTSNVRRKSPKKSKKVVTESEIFSDNVGNAYQYSSNSSLHSKTDLGSDFPEVAVVSRQKTLSTSTTSTNLESYDFLSAKTSHVDDESSSSHNDWETLSVLSNQREPEGDSLFLDSGCVSSANTTIASMHHAELPDGLPTIAPKKATKLKSSPWKVKTKTTKESKATQRRKRLTKKVKSPRSPRGVEKFLLTSSLQTFSSSKGQESVGEHEELPDLFPSVGRNGLGKDCDIRSTNTASLVNGQKNRPRKGAKSVCKKKSEGNDSEADFSKPTKNRATANKKSAKVCRRNKNVSTGAKKLRVVAKNDKNSAARLMTSSSEAGEAKSDSVKKSSRSVSSLANVNEASRSSDGSQTPICKTENLSDSDSDATLLASSTIQNTTYTLPKMENSNDDSVWQNAAATSDANSRKRRKHVLPSFADDDSESAGNDAKVMITNFQYSNRHLQEIRTDNIGCTRIITVQPHSRYFQCIFTWNEVRQWWHRMFFMPNSRGCGWSIQAIGFEKVLFT